MSIRKIIPVILIIAVAGLALAACMNNERADTQPAPETTPDYVPNGMNGANGTNGVNGVI